MDYKDIDQHIAKCLPLQMPQWIMFGDSLTQAAWSTGGVGAELQDSYARQLDVINRGYSGYNTEWALYVLPHLLKSHDLVKVFSIWLGANDSALPFTRQAVPIPHFKDNLKRIIDMVKEKYPETDIILFTPPPVSEPGRIAGCNAKFGNDPHREADRKVERTKQYAEAVVQVGKREHIPVLDIYNGVENEALQLGNGDREKGLEKLLYDGLHFTPEGYKVVHQFAMKEIKEKLPHLYPSQMERYFPWHDEIDSENPASSFNNAPTTVVFGEYQVKPR